MSFLAKLTIEEEEMNVLECSFEFTQKVDYNGRPIERPRAGLIHIAIESTSSTNIIAWMIFPNEYKSGEIIFYKREIMSSNKTLEFRDGFCVNYKEMFNAHDEFPMKTYFSISARDISINDVSYENPWDTLR